VSLRARLLLSTAGLMAVALLVAGAVLVGFTRANLIDQLDNELRAAGLNDLRPEPPDRTDATGRRFAAALADRARAGVEVSLLYDAWGSSVSRSFVEALQAAGVPIQWSVRRGLPHAIDPESIAHGGAFLAAAFGNAQPTG